MNNEPVASLPEVNDSTFRELVERHEDLICVFVSGGTLLFANAAYRRFFGLRPEAVRGFDFTRFIPPEDRDAALNHLRSFTPESPSQTQEHWVVGAGSKIRLFQWRNTATFDAEGRAALFVSVGRDITDRKRAEDALRDSEERFRRLYENAPLAYQSLNADGHILDVNAAWLDMLGYARDEVRGRPIGDFLTPESRRALDERFPRFLKAGAVHEAEFEFLCRDGSTRIAVIEGTISTDEDGRLFQTHCILSDISEMRRSAERLFFQAKLLENVRESVIATDLDRHITYWGGGAESLYGYTADEAVGKHISFIFETPDDGIDHDIRSSVLADGEWRGHVHKKRCDGTAFISDTRISLVRDAAGNPIGFVGVDHDITRLIAIEENLRRKNLDLERSNAELEAFAYAASHDLREPLRNLTSYSDLLGQRLGGRLSENEQEYLKFIRDGAMRMDHLVRDLLGYSRAGRLGEPASRLDSREVLDMAVGILRTQFEEYGATLEVTTRLPIVTASRNELQRLFVNLLANALKYRSADRAPRISIACLREAGMWRFSIRDNGIGIPLDKGFEERIFRLFQRLHPQEAHGGGTGVGLALVKKIVERHGGRIWVESDGPETGATFHFTLPADD